MTATLLDELAALRRSGGLCQTTQRFLVEVGGDDSLLWLDRLSSQPVVGMAAGGVVDAVLMDGKGRLRADLRVVAPADPGNGLLLELPASHRTQLLRLLDMYVIRERVVLADASETRQVIALVGPRSEELLAAVGLALPPAGVAATPRPGVLLLHPAQPGLPGAEFYVEREAGRELCDELLAAGAVRVGDEALEIERIAAGIARFQPDLSGDVIPLEAGLEARVSITKGCYPGQEVVARILNLGQVTRRLVRLSCPGRAPVEAGVELAELPGAATSGPAGVDGPSSASGPVSTSGQAASGAGAPPPAAAPRVVGRLTSVAYDPARDTTFALGFLRRSHWKPGTRVAARGAVLEVAAPDAD